MLEEKDMKPGECAPQRPCRLLPAPKPGRGAGLSRNPWPVPAAETHSLQTLRTVLSTGSPLKAQSYDYVYRCIKGSVLLGSMSGTAPHAGASRGPLRASQDAVPKARTSDTAAPAGWPAWAKAFVSRDPAS